MSAGLKYRREIDGLRAVAVVPVILFHAGVGVFSGGYIGVDVFFVISGYLITTILINDLEQGNLSIAGFYERRARRILPALFLVMFFCLPAAWFLLLPGDLKDFAQSLVAVTTFSSNILFWQEEGYFAAAAELKPLLHTWSLAVEEQYYLLFPLFLMFAWRFGRKRVFWSVVAIAVVSLLMAEWGWRNRPSANFYLAPTRAWELLAGSICAFLSVGEAQRRNNGLSALGFAMIVFAIFSYDSNTPFPSVYALMPVVGTTLVILFAAPGTWVGQLLAMRAFVGIGLISYSAYLWHQPLFAFARVGSLTEPGEYLMAGLAVASLLLAWATWRFVEQPFRKSKNALITTRRGVFVASGAVGGVFMAIGLAGHIEKGFEQRFDLVGDLDLAQISLPDTDDGYCFHDFNTHRDLPVVTDIPSCSFGSGDSGNRVVLFGDSYAAQWEPYFRLLAENSDMRIDVVTTNWCFPSDKDEFTAPNGDISIAQCRVNRKFLLENAQYYGAIVLGGSWNSVFEQGYSGGVVSLVETLLAASDANVIVLDTPPQYLRKSVQRAFYASQSGLILSDDDRLAKAFWGDLQRALGGRERLHFFDRSSFGESFAATGRTPYGVPYSLDGAHISVYGAIQIFRENLLGNVGSMEHLLAGP